MFKFWERVEDSGYTFDQCDQVNIDIAKVLDANIGKLKATDFNFLTNGGMLRMNEAFRTGKFTANLKVLDKVKTAEDVAELVQQIKAIGDQGQIEISKIKNNKNENSI